MMMPDSGNIIKCEEHGFDLDACFMARFFDKIQCIWTFDFNRKKGGEQTEHSN